MLNSILCKFCGKLLGLMFIEKGILQLKCRHCKKINDFAFEPKAKKIGAKPQ